MLHVVAGMRDVWQALNRFLMLAVAVIATAH